jgi:3-deoxy-D-manno-octulosonic acid kinase
VSSKPEAALAATHSVSDNSFILQQQTGDFEFLTEHFDAQYWLDKAAAEPVEAGRGGAVKIQMPGQYAILRPYKRGGLVRKLVSNQYFWLGLHRTRCWKEWAILNHARDIGLPVAEPIAVCAVKTSLISYRAAIITRYLDNTETLASRIAVKALPKKLWHRLGVVLKQLHAARIRHADLNATNILIDDQDQFYIIDFDKARIMRRLDDWQWRPLYRLQRSLDKIDKRDSLYYRSSDWQALMDGYQT